ncbi:insulinase family protein [Mediterraneibacter glycyrrhizinilyticus]|uniref:insulinase family protein n=1 Tax=Mediterraneibacter glycyrrhizinilyticus TaxID=342942 RepID=UPI00195F3ED8|nr:insulinase family protein [Mediterraneibacter glycyrrhizinilyticus]MBM6750015.1 insulinase family protein [Mediterraneibacter glycyrrhizinilyticus]
MMNKNIVNFKYVNTVESIAYVALVVAVGSFDDVHSGCAHLLEHTLIMSLNEREKLDISKYQIRAFTDFDRTIFLIKCPNHVNCIEEAQKIIDDIYSGKYIHECYMNMAKTDVLLEIQNSSLFIERLIQQLVLEDDIGKHIPIGNYSDVKAITIKELINYFNDLYKTRKAFAVTIGKETKQNAIDVSDSHSSIGINKKQVRYGYTFKTSLSIEYSNKNYLCFQEQVKANDIKSRILQDLMEYICTFYVNEIYNNIYDRCYYMRITSRITYFVIELRDKNINITNDILNWLSFENYLRIINKAKEDIFSKKNTTEDCIYELIESIDKGIKIIPNSKYFEILSDFRYVEVKRRLSIWIKLGEKLNE